MLMFLATLGASVAASFLVEAVDIECVKGSARRLNWERNRDAAPETPFSSAAMLGSLR